MMRYKTNKKLRVLYIPTDKIQLSAGGTRRFFDDEKLKALQASMERYGMFEPLTVIKDKLCYKLVSGERRLIAAKRLELEKVPAIVLDFVSECDITARSFSENYHREPLSCFEQAKILQKLLDLSKLTTEQAAKSLGLSEDFFNERLKLLVLEDEACVVCEAAGLSEKRIMRVVAMPKSERNKLFFGLLNESKELEERARLLRERLHVDSDESPLRTVAIKDVRIFFNTIDRAIDVMKNAGVEATTERHDFDGFIEYLIRIPSRDALSRN